jgi:hypothetical protein
LTGSIYFRKVLAWGLCAERCRSYSESGLASGRGQKLQRGSPSLKRETSSFRNTVIETISNGKSKGDDPLDIFCRVLWGYRDSNACDRLFFLMSPYLAQIQPSVRRQSTMSPSLDLVHSYLPDFFPIFNLLNVRHPTKQVRSSRTARGYRRTSNGCQCRRTRGLRTISHLALPGIHPPNGIRVQV